MVACYPLGLTSQNIVVRIPFLQCWRCHHSVLRATIALQQTEGAVNFRKFLVLKLICILIIVFVVSELNVFVTFTFTFS